MAQHLDRGNALQELKRFDDVLASYDRALALKPDYAEAFNNRKSERTTPRAGYALASSMCSGRSRARRAVGSCERSA